MSILCRIDCAGYRRWYLVKEGGALPAGCREHAGCDEDDVWGSYVVMEIAGQSGDSVCVYALAVDTVRKVQLITNAWISEWVRRTRSARAEDAAGIRRKLNEAAAWVDEGGMLESAEGCTCDVKEVFELGRCGPASRCEGCTLTFSSAASWHAPMRGQSAHWFVGVYPLGRSHWWTGWTVALSDPGRWEAKGGVLRWKHEGGLGRCDECQEVATK
jgi:hypothetical protein